LKQRRGNFTYELSSKSRDYLSCVLSIVTGLPDSDFTRYIAEAESDTDLTNHIFTTTAKSDWAFKADEAVRLSKRHSKYGPMRKLSPATAIFTGAAECARHGGQPRPPILITTYS
jgi:hypothetical protein